MTDARQRFSGWARRAVSASFDPVDIAWLAAYRVLFGLVMCAAMLRTLASGWVERLFLAPTFRFKYWGFEWVDVLPPGAMVALFWALAALALAVALGLFFRVAALLFAVGFIYLELVDVSNYLNHYYLVGHLAILLALSPAHRAFSLDAWLAPARARAAAPRYWQHLFRFQIGVVYFFAGMAKLHADWLIHAAPLRIWLSSNTDLPVLGLLFSQPWAPLAMSWAGFVFDSTIVGWLLFRRTRPFAYAVVIVFHVVTGIIFPIGMFPYIMTASATVFFDATWARRFGAALHRLVVPASRRHVSAPVSVAPGPPSVGASRRRALGFALAGLYCAFEILMPLRFLAYGGDVRWHEQGMRFSWRVMVREKNGSVTFLVRNKRTGRVWHVGPDRYLNRLQERQMAGQPDLILQLAHHIRDDFERRGLGPVEVRVDALVSLNGRKLAPLIDPNVDLATVRDGIGRARWILPAPSDPPPRLRPI